MPSSLRTALLVALAAGLAALALGGCGSDDGEPIPASSSQELLAQLEQIREAFNGRDCTTARSHAIELSRLVDRLPSDVVGYNELVQAGSNLNQLITDQCNDSQSGVVSTGDASSPEPSPEPPPGGETTPTDVSTADPGSTTDETTLPAEESGNEGGGPGQGPGNQGSGGGFGAG